MSIDEFAEGRKPKGTIVKGEAKLVFEQTRKLLGGVVRDGIIVEEEKT